MCQLLCGIHLLFHVDVFNLSTFVAHLTFLHWKSRSARCDLTSYHADLQLKPLTVRWHFLFRTSFGICALYGTILRYLPWNVCIKIYLRIGEAKNPGPSSKPQPTPQPKQPDLDRHMFQTVQFLQQQMWSPWWTKHLGLIVLTMNSCICL